MLLEGKHILLGISGGIAAYKTPLLIRLLVNAGAEVQVVATQNALQFVTPLTLETVSNHKVYTDAFGTITERSTTHISYAQWADILLIAPATANSIAKFAGGIADNALSTQFLAFDKKVLIAPSMNSQMYAHAAVQNNLKTLRERGVILIDPDYGALACGTAGQGRMPEPEALFETVVQTFSTRLQKKKS
ncbi:hypothetical protein FACS1894201_10460 [Bacteroidia bacterium]|nr:hypothetical protein FACS1894201_10460 [Bacteroidia bacterium]